MTMSRCRQADCRRVLLLQQGLLPVVLPLAPVRLVVLQRPVLQLAVVQ